jgi:hypothetical protein
MSQNQPHEGGHVSDKSRIQPVIPLKNAPHYGKETGESRVTPVAVNEKFL